MAFLKTKDDAPVAADLDSPSACQIAFERVKVGPREAHVFHPCRRVKMVQDETQPLLLRRLNSPAASGQKELPQSLVPEAPDHVYIVTQKVTWVNGAWAYPITAKSAAVKTKTATESQPFMLKKAVSRRERSVGETSECS